MCTGCQQGCQTHSFMCDAGQYFASVFRFRRVFCQPLEDTDEQLKHVQKLQAEARALQDGRASDVELDRKVREKRDTLLVEQLCATGEWMYFSQKLLTPFVQLQ